MSNKIQRNRRVGSNILTRTTHTVFTLLSFFFLLLITSCKKFIETDLPPSLVQSETVFANDKTAETAVVGLYSQMNQLHLSMTNGGMTVYTGLSADELYTTSATASASSFWNNSLLPDNNTVTTNFWMTGYKLLYQANLVLENLSKSTTLSEQVRRKLSGEASCIRGFILFCLVNVFGDIPLTISSDYKINAVMPRNTVAEVYNKIKNDLLFAKEQFQTLVEPASKGRIGKWATTALLARVCLYLNEWDKAELYASEILDSGPYTLIPNLNNIFPGSSTEVIWQLIRDNVNTADGVAFIPSSGSVRPAYAVTDYLLNAFEASDQRKIAWLNSNLVSGIRYYYPYKYKVRSNTTVTEYNCILRLAEQYLIRAEARAQQNNISGSQTDLNRTRNRAGLANTTASSKEALLQQIENERRVEFFAEWGHRWLDLKRMGKANAVLSLIKGANWSATDILYPIPQQSIDSNPFLVQNPGY